MAALGRYWKMPAEHLALVETICYDGTPAWQQRDWAECNGWLVREFRVTWESALALLTQGIPFAITTVEATWPTCKPSWVLIRHAARYCCRSVTTVLFGKSRKSVFERYRPFGPRGMVFLPQSESSRLNSISLPDSELVDEYHAVTLALSKHDREKAQTVLVQLESKWPDSAITWEARFDFAAYDTNNEEQIRCLDHLLELFPNNPTRLLRRLSCLRDATREERIEFLKKTCANKNADPALFVELARNLMADAPQQASAEWWLHRALR